MINCDLPREPGAETCGELRRQGDFRNQDQDLLSERDRLAGSAQIDLGLPGTGNALNQRCAVAISTSQPIRNRGDRGRLLLRQPDIRRSRILLRERLRIFPGDVKLDDFRQPQLTERRQISRTPAAGMNRLRRPRRGILIQQPGYNFTAPRLSRFGFRQLRFPLRREIGRASCRERV